jgi:uncharacterized membrane protein YfcA
MLYVSCIPLAIVGLKSYYDNKQINYYIGNIFIVGIVIGLYFGSKYVFVVNKLYGEKWGDEVKYAITAVIYAVLAVLYAYQIWRPIK